MKFFRRFHNIQGSLLLHELSFVLLVLITASVGIGWAYAWQKSSEESLRLTAMNSHTQNIRGELYRQLKEVFDAAFLRDQYAADEYAHYLQRIHASLQTLNTLAVASEEKQAIARIATAYDAFYRQTRQLLGLKNLNAQQKQLLDQQLEQQTFSQLETAFSRFDQLLKTREQALNQNRQKWLSQMTILVPIPVLIAVTLLMLSRRFVHNNLVKPLAAVMQGARRISKGDLKHQIPQMGLDDLVRLADAINAMAGELASNRDRLVEAEKQAAMGELVPLVAHNIRNPLAGIRAAAQVTLDDEPQPTVADALKDIIISVDRLERWVTSLLIYLHPNQPHFTQQSLCQIADNAISLMQLQLQDKQLELDKTGWQDGDGQIIALDANLMEQAVFNLLQNAVEASPLGGRISCSYHQSADHLLLSISDEGNGMRFDPVAEAVTDGEAKRLGCGLGIPFALKVIKQHGGQLSYDAAPGKGTRVVISLPRHHQI